MQPYTLNTKPLYAALYEAIRRDIISGTLPAGSRLPSKRTLAANQGVSVVTVESAYAQLIAEGYAEARERSGVYVCAIGTVQSSAQCSAVPADSPKKPLLDLSGGSGEDDPFPFSVWAKIMREVLSEQGKNLLRPVDFRGVLELRKAIASHLQRSRGLSVSPEQIVVGAGNEYLYGLLVQLLGRNRVYAVEDPGHRKIAGIYRANDVTLRYIPLDREGLRIDKLAESQAEIVHISPAHHYPTGIVMPVRRRSELLAWAGEGRYIIEDDYDSELRHSGKPVPPLFSMDAHGRVIYASTFSQTITPSLRIAYLCLPPQLLNRFVDKIRLFSCTVPSFEQYALARFIDSGGYERHVNRLRKRFRDKRAEIFSAIAASPLHGHCRIAEENAGTHFLLCLETDKSDAQLKTEAESAGLLVRFLSDYESIPRNRGSLIFNYACLSTEAVPAALVTLSKIIR